MRNHNEEKCIVAETILVAQEFSVESIAEAVGDIVATESIHCVLGEIVALGLVKDTQRRMFTLTGNIVTMFSISDRPGFDQYVLKLRSYRFHPDQSGKPTGLNFRLAEALVEKIEEQETHTHQELTSLGHYIALAQAEELQLDEAGFLKNPLAEAYLRTVYARFLKMQQQWANSIVQYLIASRQFRDFARYGRADELELKACIVLYDKYESVLTEKQVGRYPALIDFLDTVGRIISSVNADSQELKVFVTLTRFILDESRSLLDCLSLHTGERLYLAKRTLASSKDDVGSDSVDVRLSSLEGEILSGTYDIAHLQQLTDLLVSSQPASIGSQRGDMLLRRRIKSIETGVRLKLTLQRIRESLKSNNPNDLSMYADTLLELEFDGLFPYFVADALEEMKSVVGDLLRKQTVESKIGPFLTITRNMGDKDDEWFFEEPGSVSGFGNQKPFTLIGNGSTSLWDSPRRMQSEASDVFDFQGTLSSGTAQNLSRDDAVIQNSDAASAEDGSWINNSTIRRETTRLLVYGDGNYEEGLVTISARGRIADNQIYQSQSLAYASWDRPYQLQPLKVPQKGN